MTMRARRVRLDGFGRDPARQLERIAARHGALYASEELVVCAFGSARTIPLDRGLADTSSPDVVAAALQAIVPRRRSRPWRVGRRRVRLAAVRLGCPL